MSVRSDSEVVGFFAMLVSRYISKAGKATVASERVFHEAGLLVEVDSNNGLSGGG